MHAPRDVSPTGGPCIRAREPCQRLFGDVSLSWWLSQARGLLTSPTHAIALHACGSGRSNRFQPSRRKQAFESDPFTIKAITWRAEHQRYAPPHLTTFRPSSREHEEEPWVSPDYTRRQSQCPVFRAARLIKKRAGPQKTIPHLSSAPIIWRVSLCSSW